MLDLLSFMVMPLKSAGAKTSSGVYYGRDTHHLTGNAEPSYQALDDNFVYWVKGPNGHPWDIKSYDKFHIYDLYTEFGTPQTWNDPKSFKKFINNRTQIVNGVPKNIGNGVTMCDRYLTDMSDLPNTYITRDTEFQMIQNCLVVPTTDDKPRNVGIGQYSLDGPYEIDHGGDVNIQPTLILKWMWDGSIISGTRMQFKVCEQFYLTQAFGKVKWTTSNLINGVYVQQQKTIHNVLAIGGCPSAVNGCGSFTK